MKKISILELQTTIVENDKKINELESNDGVKLIRLKQKVEKDDVLIIGLEQQKDKLQQRINVLLQREQIYKRSDESSDKHIARMIEDGLLETELRAIQMQVSKLAEPIANAKQAKLKTNNEIVALGKKGINVTEDANNLIAEIDKLKTENSGMQKLVDDTVEKALKTNSLKSTQDLQKKVRDFYDVNKNLIPRKLDTDRDALVVMAAAIDLESGQSGNKEAFTKLRELCIIIAKKCGVIKDRGFNTIKQSKSISALKAKGSDSFLLRLQESRGKEVNVKAKL